jgi:hypothetical protein
VKRLFVAALAVFTVVAAAPPVLAEAIYRYGLHQAGETPPEPRSAARSPLVVHAFWIASGEQVPLRVEPIRPGLAAWPLILSGSNPFASPGGRAASIAARSWLLRHARPPSNRAWHAAYTATTVWMTRNWTAEQIGEAVADTASFGRGARGLEAAAAAYFEKPSAALAVHELALLIALSRSPKGLNPDCHADRAMTGRNHVLDALLRAGVLSAREHRDAIGRALEVMPRGCT